ncbi:MAG: hypothetical protein RIQ93_3401, partial [Verrucomicrobiota bacterium]
MSRNRRQFFLQGLAGIPALLGLPFAARSSRAASVPAAVPATGPKVFVGPQFFGATEVPEDIFGDLPLMRKGTASMTMGGSPTSIEPIVSREEWLLKRGALREIHRMVLGSPPPGLDCPLNVRVEKEYDRGDYVEKRVTYLLAPGERTAALLLAPKDRPTPGRAMLTIHPTTADGKEQTVGRGEKKEGQLTVAAANRAYGLHLVRRGFVTFSPDLLAAGERIFPGRKDFDNQPFIDANPTWSGTGKDLWDLRRAIDVMQTLPEIDPERIGSIGHSQGAGLTTALMAVEDRLKVGVSNCGAWPARISRNPFNNARTQWFIAKPALRPFCYTGKPFPIDGHELFALAAPRPYLNICALNDSGYKVEDESFTRPA